MPLADHLVAERPSARRDRLLRFALSTEITKDFTSFPLPGTPPFTHFANPIKSS